MVHTSSASHLPTDPFQQSTDFGQLQFAIYEHTLSRIETVGTQFGRWNRDQIEAFVKRAVAEYTTEHKHPLNDSEQAQITSLITKELAGLGPLEDLLNDSNVEDILINGYNHLFVSRSGVLRQEKSQFKDNAHVLRIVRRILAPLGRRLDESSPMVDARLPDGGRLNAIIEPLSVDGPSVSIRKFKKDPLTPEDLMSFGSFNAKIAALLQAAVKKRCNILISGGTSSGKTSLLNALAFFIPENERLVTVEDTAELSLNHPHVVRLESRHASIDGTGEISIRDLIKNCLRMRPDRVIVGEVRGSEVMDMLQAMSTGHDGSMATIHANSARECLHRIEMLAGFAGYQGSEESLRNQIASAIDFIVQIGRLPNGRRRILSITEITGMNDHIIASQELFSYQAKLNDQGEEIDDWISLGALPHSQKLKNFKIDSIYTSATTSSSPDLPTDPPPKKEGGFWARKKS